MKCPKCQKQHKKKEGFRCYCGYQFSFDPVVDKMTDSRFAAAVRKTSGNDAYYFTLHQLQAELCRHGKKSPTIPMLVAAVAGGAAIGAWFAFDAMVPTFILGAVALFAAVTALSRVSAHSMPSLHETEKLIRKWMNGSLKEGLNKLLLTPSLQDPPPDWPEPDIYDYGVERVLIVERDLLVDLLVKNNFHADQRTLVIAESGYPGYLEPVAEKVLRENPNLPVFLLHRRQRPGSGHGRAARADQQTAALGAPAG